MKKEFVWLQEKKQLRNKKILKGSKDYNKVIEEKIILGMKGLKEGFKYHNKEK